MTSNVTRALYRTVILLLVVGVTARLASRWREERVDRRVTLLADWAEIRDCSNRQKLTNDQLLTQLKESGVNGLLLGAATVQDYLWRDFAFDNRPAAENILRHLTDRGVVGVALKKEGKTLKLTEPGGRWERLKDLEVGFDPEILGKARQAGLNVVLRVNHDPWLKEENLFRDLQEISASNQQLGVLLNSDEVPGGADALPQWTSFVESQNYPQLLFEFRPPKAAMKLAHLSPRSTFRAHTIAPNELKDLAPAQQKSRWRRAVQERSCRFLLLHVSPNDSLPDFLENIRAVKEDLVRRGWIIDWPRPRVNWPAPSVQARRLGPIVALLLAILVPVGALRWGMSKNPWRAYGQIALLTFLGACVVAAVAQNSLTRIQIVPFRGIKFAFAAAWLGCLLTLYPWTEIKSQLVQTVRRLDIVIGLLCLGVLGYLLIRTGNAGAGWKAGWEQGLRDRLEDILIARPRFKEFAIGYPLLLVGLYLKSSVKELKSFWQDGRLWIGLGMIGPISMVNTFCHLHSPLYLAFLRSFNGLWIGTLLGLMLIALKKWTPL